jgi:putative hydrolase of HD superfamily
MQENDIQKILEFLKEARKLQDTYRFTPKLDGGYENNAEHSWAVAFTCMLIASRLEEEFDTKLDREKMLKMTLIHDMGEIKTGDTPTWEKIKQKHKKAEEREAMKTMTAVLPDDLRDEVMELWEECEARETLEAKIVKSADRMDPVFHRTFLGLGWDNVVGGHESLEALDECQYDRHGFSKVMSGIYEDIRSKALSEGLLEKKQ